MANDNRRAEKNRYYHEVLKHKKEVFTKVCKLEGCEEIITTTSKRKIFCSTGHATKHNNRNKKEVLAMKCQYEFCDNPISTTRTDKKYCRTLCGQRHRKGVNPNIKKIPAKRIPNISFGIIECSNRNCDATFQKVKKSHAYCSDKCAKNERTNNMKDTIKEPIAKPQAKKRYLPIDTSIKFKTKAKRLKEVRKDIPLITKERSKDIIETRPFTDDENDMIKKFLSKQKS